MSSTAALIARLVAENVSPELIGDIAEALADARAAERTLEKRRAADRERKTVANPRIPRNSKEAAESAEFQDTPLSLDKSPQTPKINPNPRVCEGRARETGYHRLPEGWTPTRPLPPKTQAKVDEWPPGALGEELAAMHRWAANAKNEQGKGRKLDWDKAWVNWIERRHDERYGRDTTRANGLGRHQPDDGLGRTARAGLAVFGPSPSR